MTKDNSFEILLYLAADEYARQEVDDFLHCDVGAYSITPEARKRAYKLIKRGNKKRPTVWQVMKHLAVACLICIAIFFTACMCIPEVRNAIKEAFIRWYDEYIEIGFGDENAADIDQPYIDDSVTDNNGLTSTNLPTQIEKKAYATYLPEGYVEKVKIDTPLYYFVSYESSGTINFYLRQIPIDEYLIWANSTDKNVTKESVNGHMAILTEDEAIEGRYTLVWQTDEYELFLSGFFESKSELFRIAEGIKLK